MNQIELNVAIMAGLVLSLFLMVGEIAALRKQAARLRHWWKQLYLHARFGRLLAEVLGVTAFFLVQPFLVAVLVLMALDGFAPDFSTRVLSELQH